MPCPHYRIKISSRSNGPGVIAQAAYQSGERLYDERNHRTKDYSEKCGIVYTEILLPENAPAEYSDRNTLWNAVEAVESQWNSQLARRFEIALPIELPIETSIQLVRQHVQEQFVAKGMIADLAVHDPYPPGHNPHAHVMLTMRPMDEHGQWMPKSRKEYVLDENGEKIRLPSGNWKTKKVSTVDWNEQTNAETWRHAWEELQNQYLEAAGRTERIDMRSYERQEVERIPTVHQGPAVTAMEARGIQTDIGNLNRDIRSTNRLIEKIRNTIRNLVSWIEEVKEAIHEIDMQPKEVYLVDLLIQKFNERSQERFLTWDSEYGRRNAKIRDLQRFAKIISYMQYHRIYTVADLEQHMADLDEQSEPMKRRMRQIEKRIRQIDNISDNLKRRAELDSVHDEYLGIHWQGRKEKYKEVHQAELDEWAKCDRYLRKNAAEQPDARQLQTEKAELQKEYASLSEALAPIAADIDMVRDIHYLIKDLLPELSPEKQDLTPERKAEKRSVLKDLHQKQQQINEQQSRESDREQRTKKQNRNVQL